MKVRDLDYLGYAELCWVITFRILNLKYHFWGNLAKGAKQSVKDETCCLDELRYAEFGSAIHLPCFWS